MNLHQGKLQNQYTRVNNLSMFARVFAEDLPEDAPVVILVHGLVLASRYMIPTAELLASKYRVYVPDFPGYGDSDKPDEVLELPELADVLCQWMDAVGIRRAIMLGNSFGCQVIAEFAIRHSERLVAAILQGPTIDPHARNLPEQLWRFALNSPYEKASQLPIQVQDYSAAGLPRVIRTIQIALSDRIEAKLPYMHIPTLVVRGENDPVVPQKWAQEVVELLPNGKLNVIPGGGHTLNYSKPVELSRAPAPNGESPEAEWGFAAALRDDVERFALKRGYKVRRIVYDEPDAPSPFVAELYRHWYQQRQINTNRLLVESFVLHEPYWTLRTGSVPFWMTFNVQHDVDWLQQYLDNADPYDEIYMMLFSQGTDSAGLASIQEWQSVLKRAKQRGEFVGVDEKAYPRDFASMMRYYTDLKEKVSEPYSLPSPLTLEQLDRFIEERGDRFEIQWLDCNLS